MFNLQALNFNKSKLRHRYVFKIFTIGAEHPTKLIFVKHLSVLNSHWEVFYKIPRSLTSERYSTKYLFLSLNQPLAGSLQNLCSHWEVLYKIHWEVFYKIPPTVRCSTKIPLEIVLQNMCYKQPLGGVLQNRIAICTGCLKLKINSFRKTNVYL